MSSSSQHKPGSIGEMIAVALPMVVSFACDTVMIFTDRLFLSKLGSQSMSASMAGGLSVFVLMAFFLGLIGYTTALVAQYLGAGKKDGCARSLSHNNGSATITASGNNIQYSIDNVSYTSTSSFSGRFSVCFVTH